MARWNKRSAGYGRDRRCGVYGRPLSGNASIAVPIVAERQRIPDFAAINNAALPVLTALAVRWLPEGRRQGCEWVAGNPRRVDRRPGSFRVNLRTGPMADFAFKVVRSGDPVSPAAYLFGKTHSDSARALAEMLGATS